MPTYEFRCSNGHDFERFFGRISEAPSEVACPECGELATRRISGGAGLIFKGSGFYITDYGKDGKKDQRTSTASGGGGDSKSSDSKGGEGKGSESKGSDSSTAGGGSGGSKGGDGGSKGGDSGAAQSSAKPAPSKPTAGE